MEAYVTAITQRLPISSNQRASSEHVLASEDARKFCQTLPVFFLAADLFSNKMAYDCLVHEAGEGRLLWLKPGVRGGPTRQPCSTKAQGPSLTSPIMGALPSTMVPTCPPFPREGHSMALDGPPKRPLPTRRPQMRSLAGRCHLLQLSSPSCGRLPFALVCPPRQGKYMALLSLRFAGGRTLPWAQALGLAGQQLHSALLVGPAPLHTWGT